MSYCNVQDWVIAVDSLDTTWGAHTISERLDYAIPVMLALRQTHLPPEEDWMVRDKTGHWVPDPSIRLIGHHRRPSEEGLTHPCPVEDNTDYTGRVLTTLETRSMAECVETCLDLGVCRCTIVHNATTQNWFCAGWSPGSGAASAS